MFRWRFLETAEAPWFTVASMLTGLLVGLALWGSSFVLTRAGIAGNGWSLSGNAILVIPFGVGPAVVAGGWTAIVLRLRAHPHWLQFGIGSFLIGMALVAASFLSLVMFGPGARDAGATGAILFGFLLYGWLLAGPIVAALVRAPDPAPHGLPVWSIAAMLLLPVTLIAGCEAGAGILPA